MSFANYDYEAQKPRVPKVTELESSNSELELDNAIKKTSTQMEKYGMLITDFNNQMKLIGGRRDSEALRSKTDSLQNEIITLGTAIKTLLSRINMVMSKSAKTEGRFEVSNRDLMLKDRLVSDFNGLNSDFQTSVKLYQERKQAYALKSQPPSVDERTPLVQNQDSQQQTQMTEDDIQQTELQYHMLLTEERNRQIDEVAQGIREVNSIFKDLGEIVSQQGEQLDTVEDNIMQMLGNTQQAARELNKAHEYQKRKGKWSCIFLVALCIIVLIIVLAVIN